jgi:hypothetical protein
MRANLGWNTWDVYHVNGVVHLQTGLRICLDLVDPSTAERKSRFDWQHDLDRLGVHSGREMESANITVRWKGALVSYGFASQTNRLVCRVAAQHANPLHLAVQVDGVWGGSTTVEVVESGLLIHADGGVVWQIQLVNAQLLSITANEILTRLEHDVYLDVFPLGERGAIPPEELFERQSCAYDARRLRTSGWLGGSADGLTRSIHWNTIWEPEKGRICTPVSREWCTGGFWGGYVLFDWDTFFCGLMAALESPALAGDNFEAILQEVTPNGFVPNFGASRGTSNDRSQPPVGAYCILKAWRGLRLSPHANDKQLLRKTFDQLFVWHRWWREHRDGNRDGLLEWGSDPLEDPMAMENHTLRAAMYESGLDNSPMYDDTVFNPETNTMELADVGLCALYALDAWALGEIAAEIGRDMEARELHEDYVAMAEAVNRCLWNEETGIYQNRHWDGRFSPHLSPTNFYPLIAGIVSPERAQRMLADHLLNPAEFWGEYVLPSISRSDPGYRQREIVRSGISVSLSDYWRGRIWGPMNFLVAEGLRRYGFDGVTHEFARKNVRLFLKEWDEENHVHENYNDLTGEGDDVPSANPLYHWGALLGYIGIQELVDYEAWGGWRFGNLTGDMARVNGIQIGEGNLSARTDSTGLFVELNGEPLVQSDVPVIVRGYRLGEESVRFHIQSNEEQVNIRIRVPSITAGANVKVRMGQDFDVGYVLTSMVELDGCVRLCLPTPGEVEIIG